MNRERAIITLTAPAFEYAQQHNFYKTNQIFKFAGLWWICLPNVEDPEELSVSFYEEEIAEDVEDSKIQNFQLLFRNLRKIEVEAKDFLLNR